VDVVSKAVGFSCLTPQKIADSSLPTKTGPDANKTFQIFRKFFWLLMAFPSLGGARFNVWTSLGLQIRYKVRRVLAPIFENSRQDLKLETRTISPRWFVSKDLEVKKSKDHRA